MLVADSSRSSSTARSDGEVPPLRGPIRSSFDLVRIPAQLALECPKEGEDRVPVPLLGELAPRWRQDRAKRQGRVTERRQELEGLVGVQAVVEELGQDRAPDLLRFLEDRRRDPPAHRITRDTLPK